MSNNIEWRRSACRAAIAAEQAGDLALGRAHPAMPSIRRLVWLSRDADVAALQADPFAGPLIGWGVEVEAARTAAIDATCSAVLPWLVHEDRDLTTGAGRELDQLARGVGCLAQSARIYCSAKSIPKSDLAEAQLAADIVAIRLAGAVVRRARNRAAERAGGWEA